MERFCPRDYKPQVAVYKGESGREYFLFKHFKGKWCVDLSDHSSLIEKLGLNNWLKDATAPQHFFDEMTEAYDYIVQSENGKVTVLLSLS